MGKKSVTAVDSAVLAECRFAVNAKVDHCEWGCRYQKQFNEEVQHNKGAWAKEYSQCCQRCRGEGVAKMDQCIAAVTR